MKIRYAIVAAAALVLTLSGCNPGPQSADHFPGLPEEEDISQHSEEDDSGVQAFWIKDGASIAISIWGSSTCPVIGESIETVAPADEGNAVRINLAASDPDEICTQDFVPYTTVFWTPVDVATTEPLEIEVGDQTVTLPTK